MKEFYSSPPILWEDDKDQIRKELLEWLIPVPYDSHQAEFARRRHPGTLQWFLDSDTYQKWIHAASDLNAEEQTQDLRTLFCPGPAGAGKTILTSAVIQDLCCRFPRGSPSNVGIAYVYCFYNRQEQQSTIHLLLALLEQLLPNRHRRRFPTRLPHHIQDRFGPTGRLASLDQIMKSLARVVSTYDRVFFVVDALDECTAENRDGLLKGIFRLQNLSKVHLFVTADSGSDVEHKFACKPSLSIQAKQEDVRSYLDQSMDELPAFGRENRDLKEEIKDTIIKAAPGSFLAAVLQFKSLAAMSSTEDVRTALVGVERNAASPHYDALYEAATLRIESQGPDQVVIAKKTLSYMLLAKCPWTFAELCHALMVKVGEPELDWDTMPSFQAIIDSCSGILATVGSPKLDEHEDIDHLHENHDNEENAMRRLDRIETQLIHRTAHEYLERTYERWLPEAEKDMAATCMAYLSLRYFSSGPCYDKSDLESRLRSFPLYFYSALHWGSHAREAFDKFPSMTITEYDFLGSSSLMQASCDVMLKVGQWPMDGDYIGGYPEGMTEIHIAACFGIVNLVRTLRPRTEPIVNEQDGWGFTALSWAAKQGHEETVEAILKFTGVDVDIRDTRGRTPISLAARQGHVAIVKMLLDHSANPNFRDFEEATPLWHAAKGGHAATVALLIKYGVDVNVASTPYAERHTPLSLAAVNGQVEVISLLLAQQDIQPRPRITSLAGYNSPCTPLGLAVYGKHPGAVEVLLSNPEIAVAARENTDGEMLLHMAVEHGHEEIVRLLLSHGMNVNDQSGWGRNTPLHLAVNRLYGSQDCIIRLLLSQANLKPDLVNQYGDTPAAMAVSFGRLGVLRMLLAKGVDMEVRNNYGLTLLGLAANEGYLPMVELLLAMDGVDADSRNDKGRTPLTVATNLVRDITSNYRSECVHDHFGVVKYLLNSGQADINSRDDLGRTPLMHSARGGDHDLSSFRMILDYEGVDIDATDNEGQTALSMAVFEDKEDKAILLLEKGADPNLGRPYEGETLLCYASSEGMVKFVREFISKGWADVQERNADGHNALCNAAKSSQLEILELLLDAGRVGINVRCGHGQTPLHHATNAVRWKEVTSFLFEKGNPDLDAQDVSGRTPLHCACEQGLEPLVSLMLDASVVNVNCRDLKGRTPLSIAAQRGQLDIVERLLSFKGVIPDARDGTGRTPLSWAIQPKAMDSSSVVQRLLSTEDVDLNAEDERGWTPLSWAVQDSKASHLVGLLLTEGAGKIDINHEDRKGRTPLALALKKGHEVIVGQLRAAGAREERRNECQDSLNNEEDHNYYGIDMTRNEVEGRGQAQQDSDGDSKSFMSGDDLRKDDFKGKSSWQRQRERTQRRRWLNPNWFDDASADGDGDSDNGSWSGSNDGVHRQEVWQSIAPQIELGIQNEAINGDECKEEELCPQCKALDLDQVFSRGPPRGFRIEADLGKVDESWESRTCAMCKLIAAVRPRERDEDCELCAYSGTTMWLSRQKEATQSYFMSDWVDTVILGLEDKAYHDVDNPRDRMARSLRIRNAPVSSDVVSYDFISRVGSNDHQQLRSLTVHRLQSEKVDFDRARGWIDCCKAHHGRRCNPSTRRPITSFRLIDCTTRDIVDGQLAMDEFVALSYVWGPSARKPATMDHVRVEHAERVVEDAIRVTQALGYRYLWVDRHCITNEDEKIRKRQLLEMNAVYANAQVTIVAAAGEDSAFGLPGVSRARQQPYARVQGHSLVAVPREPADYIQNSVWWTRGWTFQEGVLSRRRLIFTEHEVSYECRGMVARECVELPERIHRIAATRYPIHEDARVFSRRGHGRGPSIWTQISEYTERHLTHDYDILNAMLGIFEVAAERKTPVYHLCGVPIIRRSFNNTDGQTLLEAFVTGLCWKVDSGTRREGFPSWSWTGWKGRAHGAKQAAISFMFGFAIEVSMIPRHDPSEALSWAEFEAMGPKEKAALPQDYMLEMTGAAFDINIRSKHVFPPYAILYNGNAAVKGSIELYRHPKLDVGFQRRLAEEHVAAIAIGNEDHPRKALVLLAVAKVGEYWERIGVIKVENMYVLDIHGEGYRKQTFLIR
ncbi:hypothetical protein CEP53_000294 [Fusarium sp. AF-6]|nr:hypothetical protein CEP53_000294 [Fusarium sp. AF-6]